MIISLEGQEATGKSTFAYTAPLPIVAFSLDLGHERAIYGTQFMEHFAGLKIEVNPYSKVPKSYKSNDITIYELPSPVQVDDKRLVGYMEQWEYFINIFADAMQDPNVSTVVVDTMTLLRKNKCDAYLQELQVGGKVRKQLLQIEYGQPDGAIRALYTHAKSFGKNLVAVHHLRDHYASGVNRDGQIESMPDGTQEIDGVKDTLRYVDVSLRMTKTSGRLTSLIGKCGPNLAYEGNPVPDATWDRLVNMLETGWHGKPFPRRKERSGNK